MTDQNTLTPEQKAIMQEGVDEAKAALETNKPLFVIIDNKSGEILDVCTYSLHESVSFWAAMDFFVGMKDAKKGRDVRMEVIQENDFAPVKHATEDFYILQRDAEALKVPTLDMSYRIAAKHAIDNLERIDLITAAEALGFSRETHRLDTGDLDLIRKAVWKALLNDNRNHPERDVFVRFCDLLNINPFLEETSS